jgi:hypothetical protein
VAFKPPSHGNSAVLREDEAETIRTWLRQAVTIKPMWGWLQRADEAE